MTARTQLIFQDNPGDLPATYIVPPSLEVVISSVFARFDGSGAGGDFLATLDILSQNGNLVSRVAVNSQTLAAGDSARVTWAPFLRRASAATPPPSGSVIQTLIGKDTGFATSAGGFESVVFANAGGFNDGSYMTFDMSGRINILAAGLYLMHWVSGAWVFNAGVDTAIDFIASNVSGSGGQWSTDAGPLSDEASGTILARIDNAAGATDIVNFPIPDFSALVGLESTSTFPSVILTEYRKTEDNVNVVDTPVVGVYIARLGDVYE